MLSRSASGLRSERGQTSAEYIGLILVIAAIVGAIAVSGLGGTIAHGIQNAICSVGGTSCAGGADPASPGGADPASPDADRAGGSGPAAVPGAAVVPGIDQRAPADRDGIDSGPDRGSPTDRGSDGRSGSAGERPGGAGGGSAPAPEGGGPGSVTPPNGIELGPGGGAAPDPFDPPAPDKGAGKYDSESAGIGDRLNKQKWYLAADAAELIGQTDAARHLRHYLDNSGKTLNVDVGSILHDEESLRSAAGNQVNQVAAEALKGYDGKGPVDIPFRTSWGGVTAKPGSNWYRAMGSFSESVTGVVHIEPGNPPKTTVTYRVHVHDRYNWDDDKDTPFGDPDKPVVVKDKELQNLHRKGLAREYDINGTSDEITVTFDPNNPGSAAPPAGDGRKGSRSDPGRSRG